MGRGVRVSLGRGQEGAQVPGVRTAALARNAGREGITTRMVALASARWAEHMERVGKGQTGEY